MIESVNLFNPIPLSDLMKVRYASGRLSLPLREPYLVRLEHVTGLPAQRGGQGYSVFKLKILDALVHRLTNLRGDEPGGLAGEGKNPDALIAGLGERLHRELEKLGASPFGVARGAGAAENGEILNILV